jgi:hypothetical protein
MNKSQERAVTKVRRYVESELSANPEYGDQITEWEVKEVTPGRYFITAQRDMTKLSEGNLLRFLEHTYYLFSIGRGGAVDMLMGPRSLEQFIGRRWCGMNIRLTRPSRPAKQV